MVLRKTSPQAILAVIHQLVTGYGVPQEMIYVGDPIAHLYQYTIDPIKAENPNIKFFDNKLYKLGRTVTEVHRTINYYRIFFRFLLGEIVENSVNASNTTF